MPWYSERHPSASIYPNLSARLQHFTAAFPPVAVDVTHLLRFFKLIQWPLIFNTWSALFKIHFYTLIISTTAWQITYNSGDKNNVMKIISIIKSLSMSASYHRLYFNFTRVFWSVKQFFQFFVLATWLGFSPSETGNYWPRLVNRFRYLNPQSPSVAVKYQVQ